MVCFVWMVCVRRTGSPVVTVTSLEVFSSMVASRLMSYPLATKMAARRTRMNLVDVFVLNILSNFYTSKIRNRQFIFKKGIGNFREVPSCKALHPYFIVVRLNNPSMANHLRIDHCRKQLTLNRTASLCCQISQCVEVQRGQQAHIGWLSLIKELSGSKILFPILFPSIFVGHIVLNFKRFFEIVYFIKQTQSQIDKQDKNIGLHDEVALLSKTTSQQLIILFNSAQKIKDRMPVRPIIRMGDPVLRMVAEKVDPSQIASEKIQSLIQDLQDTMIFANGLGIAAPQIGVSLQVCIIEVPGYSPRYGQLTPFPRSVLINPVITPLTNQTEGFWEGCLSVPGIRGFVERPRKIKAQYYDQEGNAKQVIIEGFGAVVFQHETDHLNGTLFVDKVSNKKIAFVEEFEKFGLSKTQKVLDD